MKNPNNIDSICKSNALAGSYAKDFLSREKTRRNVISALSAFKNNYKVLEENNEMAGQPSSNKVQRVHHFILSGPTAEHNVGFQFFTPDGTTWKLANIIIVGGDLR